MNLSEVLAQIRLLRQQVADGTLDFWEVNESLYVGTGYVRQFRPGVPVPMLASPELELIVTREVESAIQELGGTIPATSAEQGFGAWLLTLLPILVELLAKLKK